MCVLFWICLFVDVFFVLSKSLYTLRYIYLSVVEMGKTDALTTKKIMLVIPETWIPKLDALKDTYGALSTQDVIRNILAGFLAEKEA